MAALPKPHDPGLVVLRRGLIAGVTAPALFAFGQLVLDQPTFALFAAFAAFAASGLVWFGGRTPRRAVAYLSFSLTGAVLVVLGTALSTSLVAGMVGMLAIAFAVRYLGVFGGYLASGGNAVLLAFVLPVMVEADPPQYGARVGGWLVGTLVAIACVLVFDPDHARAQLRSRTADICRDIARIVEWDEKTHGSFDERHALMDQVRADVRALREGWASMPFRPTGPGLVDQAYLSIIEQLNRVVPFLHREVTHAARPDLRPDVLDAAAPLRAAIVTSLRGAADLLEHHRGEPEVGQLDAARVAYRETMRAWVDGQLRAPVAAGARGEPERTLALEVVERVDEGFPLLAVSHQALSIGANALLMVGRPYRDDPRDLAPDVPEGGRSLAGTGERALRVLRSHLHLSDLTFRVAVRTGVVLAAAVCVADLLPLGHKFWVVLGALTVLRTSASNTGASSMQAFIGTVIGFVLSGVLVQVTADDPSWLWLALVLCTFLAAYAPNAVSFTLGQTSFTLFVVVLFTLIEPSGWNTGVQRVESMATGIAIALIGGVALWPRGARAVVGTALAHFYRMATRYLDTAAYAFLHPGGTDATEAAAGVAEAAAGASDGRWSADDAFNGLVGEQRTQSDVLVAWIRLLCLPATVRMVGDAVSRLPSRGYPVCDCPTAVTAVGQELDRVEAALERVAVRLLHPADTVPVSWGAELDGARDAIVDCLAAQLQRPPGDRESALGLLFVLESLYILDEMLGHVAEPLDQISANLRESSWR